MTKIQIPTEKNNLDKFCKGWSHFLGMNKGENFIVFKMLKPEDLNYWVKYAEQRIADLGLPLEVVNTGRLSTTFIVREMEVCHV